MSQVTDFLHGVNLSISQFSEESGMTRETVSRRIGAGNLSPAGMRNGNPVYRLRELLKAVVLNDDDGEVDPQKLRPFERRAHYQAELEALTLATKRGELVPTFEVEQLQAEIFKKVGECLDTLPDVLERDCGASPLLLAKIEQRLDQLREHLYTRLTEDEDADSAARERA